MDRRAKLATFAAVGATVLTGGIAVAATTSALTASTHAPVGQARMIDTTATTGPAGTVTVAPPGGAAVAAPPSASSGAGAGGAPRPSTGGVATPVSAASAAAPSEAHQAEDVPDPAPPSTTPPPTVSPPTDPGPDCSGSDDGLTEAQKQAREAACHSAHEGADD